MDRNAFAAAYLKHLDEWVRRFRAEGPAPVVAAWRQRDILTGRRVEVRGEREACSGRAVGVVSRSDVLVHDREKMAGPYLAPDDVDESSDASGATRVRDIMTPVIFSVTPDAPAAEVIKQMLDWKVHHLFVIDENQVLVGVVSTLDVLKRLHR